VNHVLTVDCSVETQIARVMSRNGFSRDQVLAIIARQATREARLAAADDVIDNDNAPLDALKAQVDRQHRAYLSLAGT
jgi:dephospho-CoA kinase